MEWCEIIAQSNDTIVLEGNHYFPPDSVNNEYFKENDSHTTLLERHCQLFDLSLMENQ